MENFTQELIDYVITAVRHGNQDAIDVAMSLVGNLLISKRLCLYLNRIAGRASMPDSIYL